MPIKRICLICSKIFFVKPYMVRRGWGKYCSTPCRDFAFKGVSHPGLDVLTIRLRTGEEGSRNFIKMTDDRNKHDWFLLSHMIWMNHNGPIPEGCVIHHKDYDKTNDVIKNLICFSNSEHSSMHMKLEHKIRKARKIKCLSPII